MSRTDKTAPWRVKAFYYPAWVEEHHDHTDHVCNLPERPTIENIGYWGSVRTDCHWTWSLEFMRHPLQQCGCSMCGRDAYLPVPRRKRERIEGKRYTRGGWLKEY